MREASIKGQTAFITGASSGIGRAVAEELAKNGVHVIITARRLDRLKTVAKELSSKYQIKAFPFQLDVQDSSQVERFFKQLDQEIDILVNNAGLALASDKLQEGDIRNWDTMIDTNVKGLLYVTKAVLPSMIKRNKGYIVNIGSVAGHDCYVGGNVYCATKYAVRAISKSLRMDLAGTAIRVTEIAPGAVETEFSEVRWKDKKKADEFYQGFEPLIGQDIADAIFFCLTRPSHVNISELVIFPQAQSSITTISRKGEMAKSPFDSAGE